MALVLNDRVLETCTSPGTGVVSLLGAATGYQTFSVGVGNTNTCYYTISDQSGPNWEVGIGTYATAGNTLTRTTVLASSNAGSLTNFISGTQNVFVAYPAEKAVYLDASSQVTLANQLNLTKATGFNLYASGAADNYMAGRLGIGFAPYNNLLLLLNGTVNSSSTSANAVLNTTFSDTNTSVTFTGFYTQLGTSTTALTNLTYYAANQGTFSGTVATQRGFHVTNTLIGGATNIGFNSDVPAGSGNFNFWAGGTAQNVFQGQTSIGGYIGSESLRVTPAASAVNYLQVTGAATGASPSISAQGSDTNINIAYAIKGTGAHVFTNATAGQQFVVSPTASTVNYLQVTGSATGVALSMSTVGTDTNIDLALTPKGTGVLQYGTYTAGVVAQAGYITIKDAGGTTRRLLVG